VLQFDIGLISGVFLGAFLAALIAGELRFQGFENADNMKRAICGAAMMGFGRMLAGGCAIGNGVTGTSIFTGTAWLALSAMWAGAIVTDFLLDQRRPLPSPDQTRKHGARQFLLGKNTCAAGPRDARSATQIKQI
jgi:uncharacterized protein